MPRFVPKTLLWRYVAHTDSGVFELEPISAATASRAMDKARLALDDSEHHGSSIRNESILRLYCAIENCLGHATTDEAGRYLCGSCAEWYAPTLFKL